MNCFEFMYFCLVQDVIEDIEGILGTTIQNMDQTEEEQNTEEGNGNSWVLEDEKCGT